MRCRRPDSRNGNFSEGKEVPTRRYRARRWGRGGTVECIEACLGLKVRMIFADERMAALRSRRRLPDVTDADSCSQWIRSIQSIYNSGWGLATAGCVVPDGSDRALCGD